MEEVLHEGSKARKMGLALKHVEYSGDLEPQMMKRSETLEKLYAEGQSMIQKNTSKDEAYNKWLSRVETTRAWFAKAEAQLKPHRLIERFFEGAFLFFLPITLPINVPALQSSGRAMLSGLNPKKGKARAKAKVKAPSPAE